MGRPKVPEAPDPARRPERTDVIDPDEIELGAPDATDPTQRGRRALRRPSASGSGGVGTGLSV